ncbi:MAG: hypothetical protein ACI92S_005033, partial [Planctomycetaceae bacterium]
MSFNNSHSGNLQATRRELLGSGMGFGALALNAMLQSDAAASDSHSLLPDAQPKAKNVILLFMRGGVSHMESFDPKPEL